SSACCRDRGDPGTGRSEEACCCHPRFRGWARASTIRAVARLAGKSIVVTGGSSGLGRAMALRFAAEGADVVVGDVRAEPREGGRSTADLIQEQGGRATFVQSDASRAADIDLLVRTAVERTGRLDVMVPNAIVAGPHSKEIGRAHV